MTNTNNSIPLSILLSHLKSVISDLSMDSYFWVRAEISNVKVQNISKHYYFEIIERNKNGAPIAKTNGTCWKNRAEMVIPKLESKLNSKISSGIICDFKVVINYDLLYGLSLNILDIVPAFTAGEHEKKKDLIRSKMLELGISENQHILKAPRVLTNIAVIAPSSAAGLGDFISEANKWQDSGCISLKIYSAIFEGSQAEDSISAAISELKKDNDDYKSVNGSNLYDLVVFLRGGGAKSSLAHLDELNIVKGILELPIPTWSAVGHEEDSILLDEYVSQSFHTPSKAASEIWNYLKSEVGIFEQSIFNIKRSSERKMTELKHEILTIKNMIKLTAFNKLDLSLKNVQHIQEKIKLKDPFLILSLGYNVLYNQNNTLIKTEEQLLNANRLNIRTSFGNYVIDINKIEKGTEL